VPVPLQAPEEKKKIHIKSLLTLNHLLLEFLVGLVLVGVKMWKVHSYGTAASNCKFSQKITK
jgi:hypothetical protein